MSSPTTYLITGANRGLGKGLLAAYLSRPNNILIAAVRDPKAASSKDLNNLPVGPGSKLLVVKIDSASHTDAAAAIEFLQSTHNITNLDVVIANAGISNPYTPVATVTVAEMHDHIAVNAIGPLVLFQAVLPLLQKSTQQPKFVVVSSPLGSIGGMESRPFPLTAYGASKAMVNYLVRKIHFEHESVVSFAVDPGWVQTDMGNTGARSFGMAKATTPVEESVNYMVSLIDGSTREKTSGHFPSLEGGDFPW